ncbi:hypothetical protein [Demequina sp.]|uniref:hypothetical protein n=1 Tax=Demequina sp. TaxID=2050685 RepID=UPI003A8B3B10
MAVEHAGETKAVFSSAWAECVGHGYGGQDRFSAAEEIENVLTELGVETVDLASYSYGATLADTLISRRHIDVRRAVLDAYLGAEVPVQERAAMWTQAIEHEATRLESWCSEDEECTRLGISSQLRDSGLNGFLQKTGRSRATLGSTDEVVSQDLIHEATLATLAHPHLRSTWAAAAAAAVNDGDGSGIYSLGMSSALGHDAGAYFGFLCADLDLEGLGRGIESAASLSDTFLSWFAMCDVMSPVRPSADDEGPPASSGGQGEQRTLILLMGATGDFLSPPAFSEDLEIDGADVHRCIVEAAGHTSLQEPRSHDVQLEFLATGALPQAQEGLCL